MRRAPLAAALLFSAVSAFAKAGFVGEGGGFKAADPATEGAMVGQTGKVAAPAAAAPATDVPAAAPTPGVSPSAPASPSSFPVARRASPGIDAPSRSIAARPAASERNASIPGEASPAGRQSLWNGAVQPIAMTPAEAAAADPDSDRANADRDYETRILGMKSAPARAALGSSPASVSGPSIASAGSASAAGGKLFVSLALDPREAGSLRDAVAGLGASAGFSADARFEAMPGPNGTVLYSGWIPAGRLADALKRPGVKSLSVEPRARPANPHETSGEFLVGLRVDDAAHAREGVDAGVSALTAAAGFRLTRVVGLETAPDGRAVAVVAGILPLSRLSRAMGLSEVAKIVPVGGVPAPAAPPVEAGAGGVSGFAKFAVERGPWLIILTLLLLLPSLRAPARRAVAIFNPYR